jgi:hypothetical protein
MAMERGSGSGHSAYAAAGIAFGRAALAFAWGAPSSVNVSADGYHRSVNISQPTDAVSSPLRPIASAQYQTVLKTEVVSGRVARLDVGR